GDRTGNHSSLGIRTPRRQALASPRASFHSAAVRLFSRAHALVPFPVPGCAACSPRSVRYRFGTGAGFHGGGGGHGATRTASKGASPFIGRLRSWDAMALAITSAR